MEMKLSGKLPEGDHNGLKPIETDMLEDPRKPRMALIVFNASKVTTEVVNGSREVTAQILHIEGLHPDDLDEYGEKLLRRGMEFRTGQPTLPMELEDEIDKVLQGVLDGEEPYNVADEMGKVDPDEDEDADEGERDVDPDSGSFDRSGEDPDGEDPDGEGQVVAYDDDGLPKFSDNGDDDESEPQA